MAAVLGGLWQICCEYSLKEMSVSLSFDTKVGHLNGKDGGAGTGAPAPPHFEVYRSGSVPKETIIFYTTREYHSERHTEMKQDKIFQPPKCLNYCPRCKEMMRRIEVLHEGGPSAPRPADLYELFSCPPCTDVVSKFRRFAANAIREKDSELILLQRLTKLGDTSIFDHATRSGSEITGNLKQKEQIKDEGRARNISAAMESKNGQGGPRITEGLKGSLTDVLEGKKIIKGHGAASTTEVLEGKKIAKGLAAANKTGRLEETKKNKGQKVGASKTGGLDGMKTQENGAVVKSKSEGTLTKKGLEKNKAGKAATSARTSNTKATSYSKIGFKGVDKGRKDSDISALIRTMLAQIAEAKKKAGDATKKENEPKVALTTDETNYVKGDDLRDMLSSKSSDYIDECVQPEINTLEVIKGNKIFKMTHEAVNKDEVVKTVTMPRAKSKPPRGSLVAAEKGSIDVQTSTQDGVLRYKLSDHKYLQNGVTVMPKEITIRKVTLYRMRVARHAGLAEWVERSKWKGPLLYPTGEELATFDENGTRLYYKNGNVALEYYRAEDSKAGGNRVVVYSTGKPAGARPRPRTVLASFDHAGNGVVFDHAGQIRLEYSQNEGIARDPKIGPHKHWKWHNLNDTAEYHTIVTENQPLIKDPKISEYVEQDCSKSHHSDESIMKSIEKQNFAKQKNKLLKKYAPFQIKMIAFKLNEHFSLKIHEQSSIFLSFTDDRVRKKLNVGMIPTEAVGEAFVEVGNLSSIESKPARTPSLEMLHKYVRGAQSAARARELHERRLNMTPSLFIHEKKRPFRPVQKHFWPTGIVQTINPVVSGTDYE